MPNVTSLATAWSTPLDGPVYAEPLLVHGSLIVATEGDSVYSLDPGTGAVRWVRHLGTPVPLSDLSCGNIDPLGITGTPAFDAATGRVFVVAERSSGGSIGHELFTLDAANGVVVGQRPIDPPNQDPTFLQQRAALVVTHGRVDVAFGGLYGDCGDYHGAVVGVATDLSGPLAVYDPRRTTTGAEKAAIWAPPGPVVAPNGDLFVATGNGRSSPPYDHSDSVLRLSPSLGLLDAFAPAAWAEDNAADLDLGSTSPALAGDYVLADGKSGTAYLLRASSLGGIGGEVDSANLCPAFGGDAVVATRIFVPCTDGIRAVDVAGGRITVAWHASEGQTTGPPVVGGGAVWSVGIGNGVLYALDPATGSTRASLPVGPVEHFATPTLSGGMVFVPTAAGVVAVRAS
jgi:outer membrane protein assembly factor BamB